MVQGFSHWCNSKIYFRSYMGKLSTSKKSQSFVLYDNTNHYWIFMNIQKSKISELNKRRFRFRDQPVHCIWKSRPKLEVTRILNSIGSKNELVEFLRQSWKLDFYMNTPASETRYCSNTNLICPVLTTSTVNDFVVVKGLSNSSWTIIFIEIWGLLNVYL